MTRPRSRDRATAGLALSRRGDHRFAPVRAGATGLVQADTDDHSSSPPAPVRATTSGLRRGPRRSDEPVVSLLDGPDHVAAGAPQPDLLRSQ
ncbi:hypothetical protein AB0L00_45350 [Actinoallomurus sp. NPDC052308]|uniref:hypothetical protein n=1 Tax=Actinoallomurus sp. NPDC052308 TaxID=3155530 RepID=UPI00342F9542